MAKNDTAPKLKVNAAWRDLFKENEKRAKPLTDDQLVEKMQKLFPSKKNKSTILRVGMCRCDYNAGRGMFKNFGEGRPQSKCYDPAAKPTKASAPAKKATKIKLILKRK